ncbi:MAG TPA: hypothetical protein VKA46_24545 [Gemmataceae bacterium]|nr:hypothetical protein [Gemmataceae bacterium]
MTADEMRPLIKRDESFRPFRVTLKDGRTFEIKDPWLVIAPDDFFVIGIPMPEDPTSGIADHFVHADWSRITKVEFLEPAVSA